MSKTKISDLRNEIAYLKKCLEASHTIIKEEEAKRAKAEDELRQASKISNLMEGIIHERGETIAALKDLIKEIRKGNDPGPRKPGPIESA